jgi:DNA polymerase/3'-5' exonuclease PolX
MMASNGGRHVDNQTIARRLTAHADSLGTRGSDLYRRRAYRTAAETLLRMEQQATTILAASGRKGLAKLPGIGTSLAEAIEQLIRTGDFTPRCRRRRPRLRCGLVELPPELAPAPTSKAS